MNWGFHFHIPGSRAGAPQDPNDFKEPFRDFHPQSAQFLRWLWCHRYHQNTGCPHTQAWTVSVTTTWATETPGFPVNDPEVGLGKSASELDGRTAPTRSGSPDTHLSLLPASLCPFLPRSRSGEPIQAAGRHHEHGSHADGLARFQYWYSWHKGVLHWPIENIHRWRPRLDPSEVSHQHQSYFTRLLPVSPTRFCFSQHFSIFSTMKGGLYMFWLAVCHTFTEVWSKLVLTNVILITCSAERNRKQLFKT